VSYCGLFIHAIEDTTKKKHTLKNNLIIDIEERLVQYLSETYPGRIHDKCICDIEELVFPPEINLFQDTGFQGYQPPGVTTHRSPIFFGVSRIS
jgi:hypothetical protein